MGKVCSKQRTDDIPSKSTKEDEIEVDLSSYIQHILHQPSINIKLLPDSIESKIYETLFMLALEHIRQFLSTLKLEFLDYEVTLEWKEKQKDILNSPDEMV